MRNSNQVIKLNVKTILQGLQQKLTSDLFAVANLLVILALFAPLLWNGRRCRLAHGSHCRIVWSAWNDTKRAFCIICCGPSFTNRTYESFCGKFDISSLSARRDELANRFFRRLIDQPAAYTLITPL